MHRTVFEEYIRNEKIDIHNLMCYIYAHDKQQPSPVDDSISGDGNVSQSNSTTEALVSLV